MYPRTPSPVPLYPLYPLKSRTPWTHPGPLDPYPYPWTPFPDPCTPGPLDPFQLLSRTPGPLDPYRSSRTPGPLPYPWTSPEPLDPPGKRTITKKTVGQQKVEREIGYASIFE